VILSAVSENLNLNPDRRLQPAPEHTELDWGIEAAKVLALPLPFLGTGVALFSALIAPLRTKRLSDWLEDLRLKVNELAHRVDGFTWERLANDEAFASAFSQATEAALRTHQSEKLQALRNALLNVAAGTAPNGDVQSLFLTFVDSFTPTHIQILALFNVKEGADRRPFTERRDLSDQAVRDLRDRGLLRDGRAYAAQNRESTDALVTGPWTVTHFGRQFLEFISSPLDNV
jgi:hypothetical protein